MAGGSLVTLEKNKPNCPPDVHPIAVGDTLRRLASKCICAFVKNKTSELFFSPFQLGVACPSGAEKIIHGLRSCVDGHWLDGDFAIMKIDLRNAFNQVSRQAVQDAVNLHFPELLPWPTSL